MNLLILSAGMNDNTREVLPVPLEVVVGLVWV